LLNPVRVLERGYSIVEHDGAIVRDARQVSAGDGLRVQLARGVIEAEVKSNQ
jgi:exodeoxyribonuclease VII large subunit